MSTDNSNYQAGANWTTHIATSGLAYPAEYVIRIFRGSYPGLRMPKPQAGQSVLDVGCGDGRHLPLFRSIGLDAHGIEISKEIVDHLRSSLGPLGVPAENLQVGSCADLPYPDAHFDYVIAWNSAYYMSLDGADFEAHAKEMTRVLKPGGWFIISVPKTSAFIFDGSEPGPMPNSRVIQRDPFGVRNGEIMRTFDSGAHLAESFAPYCEDFCHGDVHDDCFGFAYHWHLLVAKRK